MATKKGTKKAVKKSKASAPKTTKASVGRGLAFPGMPGAGSRLSREYKGKTYTVTVTKSGFTYAGKQWDSLTAIAREITGIQMLSGPGFFKVKTKAPKAK